jgi:hypothetical protein
MHSVMKFSLPVALAGMMALAIAGAPVKAHADVIWTLSGVTFNDGGTASGSFVTNDAGGLLSFDITTTAGSSLRAETFDSADNGDIFDSNVSNFLITSDDAEENLSLAALSADFSAASVPGPVLFDTTDSTSFASDAGLAEVVFVTGGEVTGAVSTPVPAPEPMSMALLATGLVGVAFTRRRA